MLELKKQVEQMLKNYPVITRELKVLEFELERITSPLNPNTIEDRILSHSDRERVSGTHQSDKTADMVVEHVARQQGAEYHALISLIRNMRAELQRLEYYLSMLPENEANVIKQFYFEEMAWSNIIKNAPYAYSTMRLWKKKGIDKLVHYYSMLDKIDAGKADMRAKVSFISYIHEERFYGCLELTGKNRTPGVDAMLYILSGCNELWQAGIETFFSFKTGETISYAESKSSLSGNGQKLLRLAYHFANGFGQDNLVHVLRYYFPGLEYINLELAIEALKLALFPGTGEVLAEN